MSRPYLQAALAAPPDHKRDLAACQRAITGGRQVRRPASDGFLQHEAFNVYHEPGRMGFVRGAWLLALAECEWAQAHGRLAVCEHPSLGAMLPTERAAFHVVEAARRLNALKGGLMLNSRRIEARARLIASRSSCAFAEKALAQAEGIVAWRATQRPHVVLTARREGAKVLRELLEAIEVYRATRPNLIFPGASNA